MGEENKKSKAPAIAGWVGMIIVLTLYGLATNGVLLATGSIFLTFNLLGGVLLGISAFATRNWPIVLLNMIWVAVSVVSLIRQ
jgi:hypothetical protein